MVERIRTLVGEHVDILCFAFDVFGNQFSVCKNIVHVFDVKTGETR